MEKRACLSAGVLALLILSLTGSTACRAQDVKAPRLDPSVCQQVQAQINDLVAVSESAQLSDDEKVAALHRTWRETWQAVQERSQSDPEMGAIVKEIGEVMGRVLTMGMATPGSGNRAITPDARQALADLKDKIKPYVAFMKLLCPEVTLPPALVY